MSAPSVLEYARFHGLAIDHTSEDPLAYISQIPLQDIEDGQQLPDQDFSVFADDIAEPKLQLTRHEGTMLAESILDRPPVVNWSNFLPERHRLRNLKIEEPLLAGDHESEVRRFRREASSQVDTEHLFETCSLISSASGQDFEDEWNDIQSGHVLREVEQELEDERCHTTKEGLVHLSISLKDTLSEDTKATILHSFVPVLKRPRLRSVTPPLMPDSPEPQVPPSPNLDFSLRSEEDIDRDNFLLQLEKEMQEKDQIPSEGIDDASPTTSKLVLKEIHDAANLEAGEDLRMEAVCASFDGSHQPRKNLENLWLDVPMISSSSQSQQSSEQAVKLSSPVEPVPASRAQSLTLTASKSLSNEVQPGSITTEWCVDSGKLGSLEELLSRGAVEFENDGFEAVEDDLDEELAKFAEKAEKEIDAGLRGDKIDTPEECLKQPIPRLEPFSTRSLCDDQDADLLLRKIDEVCLVIPNTAHLQNDPKLNWSPFPPQLTKLQLVDGIEDDGKIGTLVGAPQGVVKSEQLLWKPSGLRMLETNDESDGEMEEDPELRENMSRVSEPIVPAKRLNHGSDSSCMSPTKKSCTLDTNKVQGMMARNTGLALNGFSSFNALEAFLDLRGAKFKRAAQPQPPSANELADDPIQATQLEEEKRVTLARGSVLQQSEPSGESNPCTIQVPSTAIGTTHTGGNDDLGPLMESKWPRTILIETTTLGRYRSLVSFLETNGGKQLRMIYREITQSERNTPSASPDIILNPRTALMFTNMQALHQKSLPGQGIQAGESMIQSRILKLAHDYTQLFILVAMTARGNILLQSQVDTMNTFAGFCEKLSSRHGLHVHPLWISSSSGTQPAEAALSWWTWNLACCHGFPVTDPSQSLRPKIDTANLINEETLWERFLRKAGLNPMAAQVVLGGLRRSDSPEITLDQDWGLRRFVKMDPDERMDMFAETLGQGVLERVNAVLDKDWGWR
ncbi:hypothetical protein CLAIMM_11456 [Cladophialophora immunda]|nr:hypothetical protein CLAIMM_11456 [Cladophialophora immunda]